MIYKLQREGESTEGGCLYQNKANSSLNRNCNHFFAGYM